jgi:hypothetical protein
MTLFASCTVALGLNIGSMMYVSRKKPTNPSRIAAKKLRTFPKID